MVKKLLKKIKEGAKATPKQTYGDRLATKYDAHFGGMSKPKPKAKAKSTKSSAPASTRSSTPYKAPSSKVTKGVSTKRKPNKAAADTIAATTVARPKLKAKPKTYVHHGPKGTPSSRLDSKGATPKSRAKTYSGRGSGPGGPVGTKGRAEAAVSRDRAKGKKGYGLGISNDAHRRRDAAERMRKAGTLPSIMKKKRGDRRK